MALIDRSPAVGLPGAERRLRVREEAPSLLRASGAKAVIERIEVAPA